MKEDVILAVKDLSVIYQTDLETVYAVNGVSFTLGRGESLGLVGETGAGKTTLALSIMQLLPERTGKVTGGEIWFEGEELTSLSEQKMRTIRGRHDFSGSDDFLEPRSDGRRADRRSAAGA